jgi:hypothetical protein
MKVIKKPIDYAVKQLQSKRYHVKKQDNKKAYDRERAKKAFGNDLNNSVSKEADRFPLLAA